MREHIKKYPKFLVSVLAGLLKALLTTPEGVLFTILGALLCWAVGIPLGLSIALGLYTLSYLVGKYVEFFGSKLDRILLLINERNGRP